MKIFSNFDTNRKQEALVKAQEKFWSENILVLRKSKLFLFNKVLLPVLWHTLLFIAVQFPIYFALEDFGWIKYIASILLFIVYLVLISPYSKYYIDYTMDFSIITPDSLTRYNQTWIFQRDIKTSNVRNIKTISIQKNNFLYNIFDNWDLIFLSEWDKADQWEITLHYIPDPESKKKQITKIMRIHNFTH